MIAALLLACAGPSTPSTEPTAETGTADPDTGEVAEDLDRDGVSAPQDCDDADPTVFPGAPERCDGADQDCDGAVDEGFDLDGDGWLTGLDPGCAALGPTDCDDRDPEVHPLAVEDCDGVDDDCDGTVDPTTDADLDGVPVCEDCDDEDDSVRPGAVELCDARDNDCNGTADEPFDGDGDGVGACVDCDDDDPVVNPWAAEVCDGADNDCDGERDEGFDQDGDGFPSCRGDCDDADPAVNVWAEETCDGTDEDCDGRIDDTADGDGDGYFACGPDPDCDDARPEVNPGAVEVCDGRDTDCDGSLPAGEEDQDGDGEPRCLGDCDDLDPDRASGQDERCDGGVDNDCDPATDEAVDGDGDLRSVCQGDCDDEARGTFPNAPERCNGVDDDCDGDLDDGAVCPCPVEVLGGHAYQFCTDDRTWEAADRACRGDGYHLVTMDDEAENVWVSDRASVLAARTWWAGFNDRAREGEWVWSSGDPVGYTSWAPGEPNDSGGQDCMTLLFSGYDWDDLSCTATAPYVCEASP